MGIRIRYWFSYELVIRVIFRFLLIFWVIDHGLLFLFWFSCKARSLVSGQSSIFC